MLNWPRCSGCLTCGTQYRPPHGAQPVAAGEVLEGKIHRRRRKKRPAHPPQTPCDGGAVPVVPSVVGDGVPD